MLVFWCLLLRATELITIRVIRCHCRVYVPSNKEKRSFQKWNGTGTCCLESEDKEGKCELQIRLGIESKVEPMKGLLCLTDH